MASDRAQHTWERGSVREEISQAAPSVDPVTALASQVGNRAFTQIIGRVQGDGIMPSGAAHPAVQQMIESRGGRGMTLGSNDRQRFGSALGDSFSDVSVHTDNTADQLCRSVNANAFALRTSPTTRDVFFAKGNFSPGSASGDRLMGEELAHLHQQKDAAMTSELKVSDPNSQLEQEAAGFAERFTAEG